jgi:hypothetical protein
MKILEILELILERLIINKGRINGHYLCCIINSLEEEHIISDEDRLTFVSYLDDHKLETTYGNILDHPNVDTHICEIGLWEGWDWSSRHDWLNKHITLLRQKQNK